MVTRRGCAVAAMALAAAVIIGNGLHISASRAGSASAHYALAIRSCDWTRWPGLPKGLSEKTLRRDLGLGSSGSVRTPTLLGRRPVTLVERPELRYWIDATGAVVLAELRDTRRPLWTGDPADLVARLGRPDRQGPGRLLITGASTTEFVFAAKGLALTVAESNLTPPASAPRVASILLFTKTDLHTFILERGGNDRAGPKR